MNQILQAKSDYRSTKTSSYSRLLFGESRLPAKPISSPDQISILVPTRERVQKLAFFLSSLERTIAKMDLTDVWIYVDEDDQETLSFLNTNLAKCFSFSVNAIVGPRTISQAEMVHALWQESTSNAGIFISATDDSQYISKNWDDKLRAIFNMYPDRLALVYPEDPVTPGLATIPILSAEWLNLTGRFFTEYFPFWFEDVWLDEVAQMIGRKVKAPMAVEPQGGKGTTPRMHNLPFWQFFFLNTADERLDMASALRKALLPETSSAFKLAEETAAKMSKNFVAAHTYTVEQLIQSEAAYADPRKMANPKSMALYQVLESHAVNHLWFKFESAYSSKDYTKALGLLETLKLANQRSNDIAYLSATCLSCLGDNSAAEAILNTELSRNPNDLKCKELLAQLNLNQGLQNSQST